MRTTLTVDDDLLADAKRLASDQGVKLTVIINQALRRGLAEQAVPSRVASPTLTYGADTPTLSSQDYHQRLSHIEDHYLADEAGL